MESVYWSLSRIVDASARQSRVVTTSRAARFPQMNQPKRDVAPGASLN